MAEPRFRPGQAGSGGPRSSLDRVMEAGRRLNLKSRSVGSGQLMMQCPVHHPDRDPSLHVTWGVGSNGGFVLLWCHGCNAGVDDLLAGLGLAKTDLWDEPLPPRSPAARPVARRRSGQRRGKLGRLPDPIVVAPAKADEPDHEWVEVERYPYVDAAGRLVQEVVREECRACPTAHKNFPQQWVAESGRLVSRAPVGFCRVLYRLPQVLEAVRGGLPVWVMEGEKDVHTAERCGLVATTNPQGGRHFTDEFAAVFAGATVHAVLDRDDTGWARGLQIYDRVTAAGGAVRLFLPATAEAKSDFTDHVEAGHGVDALIEVNRSEVATWDGLHQVRAKAELARRAVEEADAQLARAEGGADADTHRRYARRWVLESQIRYERVDDAANVAAAQAVEAGSGWAAQAMEQVQRLMETLLADVRRLHEQCGVAVPAVLRRLPDGEVAGPAAPEPDGQTEETGETFTASPGNLAGAPVFRVVDNAIVQWEPPRRRRGAEDEDAAEADAGHLKVVLSLAVRVIAREFLEIEHADGDVDEPELMGREGGFGQELLNPPPPRQLAGFVVAYVDPTTGEEIHARVGAEQWKDHSWLDSLPGPPDYDHRKSGLDNIQRAVLAVSPRIEDTVRYRSTGWRCDGERHMYVHARGVIGADGHRTAATLLTGPLARYNLPDPISDPVRLRAAFVDHSAALLDRIPARVAAPLLGQIFRSVLGPNPWVLTLVGPPGSYKTSVAAKAMHHFGELWDHTKPTSSMSGNGDTLNAMRLKLHNAKDALYWMDDFAPTKRWVDAQKLLEEITRLIHNQEERNRSSRDGLSMTEGTGPRASGLATSEVMPRPGSGAERMLVVPLARDDIDTALLFPLDEPESRYARAVLMASFISWLARDLPRRRRDYLAQAAVHAERLAATGETVRQAAALANTWVGWAAMGDFLVEAGAIDADERGGLLGQVEAALQATSKASADPDLPTRTGARVRELLAYALASGLAYVDNVRTGEDPPWPLARRLGWRRTITDVDQTGNPSRVRLDRAGDRLGYVLADPDDGSEPVLLCEPAALEPVLKAAAAKMADGMQIDRNTANRALAEEGILIPDLCEEGKTRFTKARMIPCEQRKQRLTVLRLYPLLGDDPDDNPDTLDTDAAGDNPRPGGRAPGSVCGAVFGGEDHAGAADASGPHTVDPAGGPGLASTTPPTGETTPMPYTDEQPPPHESVPFADRDGIQGWSARAAEPGPCLVCGRTSSLMIGGHRIHPFCWRGSTATQRQAPGGAEPVVAADPEPAPTAPAHTPAHPSPATRTDQPAAGADAPKSRAAAAGVREAFRAAAAVVDADHLECSDGSKMALPFDLRHGGDLARLAGWLHLGTQITKYRAASGQIFLTAGALARLGVDPEPISSTGPARRDAAVREATQGHPMVTGALAEGWTIGGKDGDSFGRWTRIWRDNTRSAWVAVLPAMSTDANEMPILADQPDPAVLARRLGLLTQAIGHPFQLSSGTTGLDLMMALRWKDRERLFSAHEAVDPAANANTELDVSWCRPPTEEEAQHTWVHAYDRSGSYLAGGSLEVGIGVPVHHPDGCAFDPKLPGYWRMEIPPSGDWRMPHPLDPSGRWDGRVRWATTPAVQFAVEQDYPLQIVEAYTWPEHGRVMEPWYERMRDGRTRLDVDDADAQAARDQVKLIYAHTFGMMGSSTWMRGRPGYAPERRHHVVAKARTNILRRIASIGSKTGRWPVAVVTDTIVYTSSEPDPVKAWPGEPSQLGRGLGQYKPEATGRLADQLPYLTGGPYKGRDALIQSAGGGGG